MKQTLAPMMSSLTNEWETPADLYKTLDDEFHFTLDPCATEENHKCDKYYTVREDGLKQPWGGDRVFCNPPYGRQIHKWVRKAYEESLKPKTIVVMLIPARTDTRYFHDYILHRSEIRYIEGRIRFGEATENAPFASMIVIFRAAGVK